MVFSEKSRTRKAVTYSAKRMASGVGASRRRTRAVAQRRDGTESILLVVARRPLAQFGQRFINPFALRVSRQHISAAIHFFDYADSAIEVVGGTERAGFLDSPSEGIVLEGCGANSRIHGLREAILEVPGEGLAAGVGEGIAVCVVGVAAA
jgi:hypothetical protein